MGFQGSNASGRRIVLLPGAFWAHGASKMAILGASLLLSDCILQCFGASEGMLPPGACRSSRASAKRIVSCRGLCVSSLCSQIPLAPAPTFGAFRSMKLESMHPQCHPQHAIQDPTPLQNHCRILVVMSRLHRWETDFLPLLVLARRGRSTGKNQYW